MNLRILYRTDPRIRFCPDCGKQGVLKKSRSRTFFEKLVKFFTWLKTYRCRECGWRGYRSEYVFRSASFKAIFFYILLLIFTAFAVSFILKRFIVN